MGNGNRGIMGQPLLPVEWDEWSFDIATPMLKLNGIRNMGLKEKIEAAFIAVPYPGDANIIRCPYNCRECSSLVDYFRGKLWTGHEPVELQNRHLALALFTPEAFRYYLPAFMLASLELKEKAHVLPDAIRFQFEYFNEYKNYFAVRLSSMTMGQRQAVIAYLLHKESQGAGSSEEVIGLLNEDKVYA